MSIVIGLSGKIGSGKTTMANFIAEKFNIIKVSFGDYVRIKAKERNLKIDRKTLQNLGQALFEENVDQFCKNVLTYNNWDYNSSLLIDGIRHQQVYQSIKKIVSPLPFYLIYINTDDKNRMDRLTVNDLKKLDNHPTEFDVKNSIQSLADLVINGNKSAEIMSEIITNWLANKDLYK